MKRFTYLLAILATAMFTGAAGAQSVGIHFCNGKAAQKLRPHDTAGSSAVAQSHWNNVTVKSTDPNGHWNKGGLKRLVDNKGKTVKGMAVKVNSGPNQKAQLWPADGVGWGFMGPNLTLQKGMVYAHPFITVSGIPYAHYNVYVYADAGANGGDGSATISVAGGANGAVSKNKTYYYHYAWANGHFVRATATSRGDADKTATNYMVFKGNTAKAFTIDFNGTLGGGWTGVSGIQIVATK